MDFTREPIIESIITPREGYKLVVRSSKSVGQEEYFVDAVELASFGHSLFLRSIEKPKSFLLPVTDYEVVEVRESRMVLKNVGLEKTIKIGGGRDVGNGRDVSSSRDVGARVPKETVPEILEIVQEQLPVVAAVDAPTQELANAEAKVGGRLDKKRDRRRNYRRRRGGKDDGVSRDGVKGDEGVEWESDKNLEEGEAVSAKVEEKGSGLVSEPVVVSSTLLSALLPPPSTLISETIARYKDNVLFKGAFFQKEEDVKVKVETSPLEVEAGCSENLKQTFSEGISLEPSAEESFDAIVEPEEGLYSPNAFLVSPGEEGVSLCQNESVVCDEKVEIPLEENALENEADSQGQEGTQGQEVGQHQEGTQDHQEVQEQEDAQDQEETQDHSEAKELVKEDHPSLSEEIPF